MPDDAGLMARVLAGDQGALEQLFAKWEAPLVTFFTRIGCPRGWEVELAEEVLVTVYRRRADYDQTRAFAPWVYGIARMVWKDCARRRGRELARRVPLDDLGSAATQEPSPADRAETRETVEAIQRTLGQLTEEQRMAFVLRHYHGLRYREIADVLQIPVGTAKWRIHDVVRRLAAVLASS